VPPQTPADEVERSRAPFVEHLRELRTRLLYSVIAVAIGFGITWTWVEQLFKLLLIPLQQAAATPDLADVHVRSLTEGFFVLLKTAIFGAVLLASPVILYQIWKFVAPGLYPNERRATYPFVFFSTLFFIGGAAFCYFGVLPYGYQFLLAFGSEVATPMLLMEEYLDLTTKLMLAFGFVFEMPVFATFLARIGVINWRMLAGAWRYAFVLCFIVGAMLTPPDVISQVMLATPMFLLYLLSILSAWIFGPRPPRDAPDAEAT